MSYILDALRKADAQRQRTRLPGLHAQAPAAAPTRPAAAWWRSPIAWAVGSVLVVAAVVLAWPSAQQPVAVPVATTAMPREAASAAATQVAQAPAPSTVPEAAPAPATAIQPAPPPPVPERHAPIRASRSTPDRVAAAQARDASAPAAAPIASAATAPAPAPVPGPGPAVKPAQATMPPAESGSTPPGAPKLAITGGVYSANAAQRLLIVGGQVFNEGSEVAPGVVLEQVRPNQALLSFQGQRYTVRY